MIRNYPNHMELGYNWRYCRITNCNIPHPSNAGEVAGPAR